MADLDRRRILVVDDEERMVRFIRMNLEHDGFQVGEAFNGKQAIQKIRDFTPDLILLDVMMPDIDGFDVLETIRDFSNVPVIMLTAKGEEDDRVRGLEHGADDYITKPFSLRELLARVKAILRRVSAVKQAASSDDQTEIHIPGLSIFLEKRKIILHGNPVDLTAKEFDLLALFATHPGRAYSRQELLDIIWGYQFDGYDHTVNSHINRLRSKIEHNPSNPTYVKTVWCVGYRFVEPEELAQ